LRGSFSHEILQGKDGDDRLERRHSNFYNEAIEKWMTEIGILQ
jgi:hypothetical protein